jgi:chromosome partitioning protein
VQELDEGGQAPPHVPAPSVSGRSVPASNVMASSRSVVADLTDEHYLDADKLESLFQPGQRSDVDQNFVVPAPSDGVAQPIEREPLIGPTGRPWPDLPMPPPLTEHGPALIIAMCNQKGGVGKTTTAINLGAALAELGRHVLLVDFDPQGSLSVGLGVNPHTLPASIYNLLMGQDITIDEVINQTNVSRLDILPSNIDLSAAEIQLVSEVAREQTLLRLLEAVRGRYDVILIDCAPSLGLLTINALTASDRVIMPLECEFFALRGIALLTDTIAKVQDRLNQRLEILGILGTMYDPRTLHSREVLERVVQAFGEQVFHTVIRRTVKFPETTVAGEPITTYAPTSPGAESYRTLAREVLARCRVG